MDEAHAFKVAKIVSTPNEQVWTQTLASGESFAVLSVESSSSAISLGKELIVLLEEAFEKQTNHTSLKPVLQEILTKATPETKISCLIGRLVGFDLHFLGFGRGTAFLVREGKIGKIFHAQSADEEIFVSSGFVQQGDIVILTTEQFQKLVPQEVLEEFFLKGTFDEAVEQIGPIIHGQDQSFAAAAVIVQVRSPQMGVMDQPKPSSLSIPSFDQAVHLGREIIAKRGKFIVGAFLLLLLLFVGIGFGIRQGKTTEDSLFAATLIEASQKYEEGNALITLNRELSRESLLAAKSLLEKDLTNEKDIRERDALLSKVNTALRLAMNIHEVSDPSVFFDLSIVKSDLEASSMSYSEEKLYILDKKQNAAYSISLSNKSYKPVASKFEQSQQLSASGTMVYVLDIDGVWRVEADSGKKNVVVEKDESNTEPAAIAAFASNVYLLDKKTSQIIKYVPTTDEKYAGKNYLVKALDFSNGVSMAIDGSVYVLLSNGEIFKFLEGRPDTFVYSKMDPPLQTGQQIFTDKESNFVYVLDKDQSRIVVLAKNGDYEAQYRWSGIKDASGFVVSEKEKKIMLVSGQKIYTIDLQ